MSFPASSKSVVYLALELSCSTWLVAARLPGAAKPSLHRIDAGDTAALLALIARLRKRGEEASHATVEVVGCYEAGRDGFWLHRALSESGAVNHVLEPTSILVSRRARRAKTDRLDAEGLLRVLMTYWRGAQDWRREQAASSSAGRTRPPATPARADHGADPRDRSRTGSGAR